jgi:integral membrane sensor domain MASE1
LVITNVKRVKSEDVRYLVKVTLLFATYFITARIGLSLDAVSGFAALVWPPTGIALAAIFILGYRYWPGIMLAAFLVNVVTGAPPLVALGIGVGNTLEALLGAYLLTRFIRFQSSLERIRDVLGLIFLAALGSTLVSATIGVSSLLFGGVISQAAYAHTWIAWWVGDMLGVLVVTPFILVWSGHRPAFDRKRFFEALLLSAVVVGMSSVAFQGFPLAGIKPFTFVYVIFPILIWIALRWAAGQRQRDVYSTADSCLEYGSRHRSICR